MKTFHSPLRYPGGKSCIFPFVSKLFYENNIIGINYAEPYAGGAGLALRLLFDEYVNNIFINDLDRSIYSFWKTVINNPDKLCSWISDVEISVENWKRYKEVQNNAENESALELAKSTLFLNRTNVSGVIKGGIIGGFSQKGKYKIDARFRKDDIIKKIEKISQFKKRIKVSNLDGLEFIKSLKRERKDTFIYIDPPYLQKGGDLYMNFFNKKDHEKLSRYIKKMSGMWLISYDNHKFIIDLYSNKSKVTYKLAQCTSNRIGDEILIFSPEVDFSESIRFLKSPVIIDNLEIHY